MDAGNITLLGGMIVTVIAALAAAVVSVINAMRLGDVKQRQDAEVARIDTVSKDTEAIKGHVNSEKTAAEGRQRLLENENLLLKEMLADKRLTASLLAQAAASRSREAGAATQSSADSLQKIDDNTAAIAVNTEKPK